MTEEIFTVYAYDLNTNTLLAYLPVESLTFGCRLNDSGPISFELDLQSAEVRKNAAPVLQIGGNPFACYVDLNGVIVWGGIAWTGAYTKSTGKLTVGGEEPLSWANSRVQAADYSVSTYPAGYDPAQFINLIISDAQSAAKSGAGASIGLQVRMILGTNPPDFVPGYPLTQRTTLNSMISDMTKTLWPTTGGIDVTVLSQWSTAGVPLNTVNVWTPRAGRTGSVTGLTVDLDSCIDYTWSTDATQMGTNFIVTGAGTGSAMPIQTRQAPGVPVGGLGNAPRLDKVINHSQIQTQSMISAMATGDAQQFGGPVATPTVTVPTFNFLGSFIPGDDISVYTSGDDRFPNGKDEVWRIVSYDVTVPDQGLATVQLNLNQPPVF